MADNPTTKPSHPLKATCHCGAITVIAPNLPDETTECRCSICRRYGVVWGYWKVDEVKFEMKEGAKVSKYVWGDREKSFDFCSECGCICYWWPFDLKEADGSTAVFGLNTNLMDPRELLYVDRKIENAWLLKPINNPSAAHRDDQAKY